MLFPCVFFSSLFCLVFPVLFSSILFCLSCVFFILVLCCFVLICSVLLCFVCSVLFPSVPASPSISAEFMHLI